MTKLSTRSGHAKVLVILLIAGVIGFTLIGAAGTLLYLNRDKISALGQPKQPVAPEEAEAGHPLPPPPDPSVADLTVPPALAVPGPADPDPGPAPFPSSARVSPASLVAASKTRLNTVAAATERVRRPVAASAPIHATEGNYRKLLNRKDVLVLVDYYADWCGPCRKIAPSLARLASRHGDKVVILKIDIDREKKLAATAGVRSIPDVRILHGGKQLERVIGGYSYNHYESLILKHVGRLPTPTTPAVSSPNPASRTQPAPSPGGTITPLKEDWLPPGVQRTGS